MRAKFNGMEVEGTTEEILKMKDELDRREEVKHNYKIVYNIHTSQTIDKDGIKFLDDYLVRSMQKYPNHTHI